MSFLKEHKLFLLFLIIVCAVSIWGHIKNFQRVVIRSDGTGYYEYLPAFIQYKDPWLEKIRERRTYEIEATVKHNIVEFEKGKYVIKYPLGPALLWLPFYVSAHIFSNLHPAYPANSYSEPYLASVSIAASFYFLAGLTLLYHFLRKKYSKVGIFVSFLAITFGTNIFHYSTFDACFSHVYSFFGMCLWLYMLERFFCSCTYSNGVLLGIAIGLLFLIRNTNIIFAALFLPYYFEYPIQNKEFYKKTAVAVSISILCVLPHFIYYYAAYGKFVLSSYGLLGEGFTNWDNPQFFYILFSVQIGLFFWSPIVVLAFIEYLCNIIKGPRRSFAVIFFITFAFLAYLNASWWAPNLGAGFGYRGFIVCYPLFIIAMAAFIHRISDNIPVLLSTCVLLLCLMAYSYLLMLGYWNGIIPYASAKWIHWKAALYMH